MDKIPNIISINHHIAGSRAATILLFIERNLGKPLTIKIISKKFGISNSTVQKYFYQNYKTSFHHYVEETRMKYAVNLIVSKRAMIKQAMILSGYKNKTTFIKAFKKYFNMLPSEMVLNLPKSIPDY